mmetsp:Transcript_84886/g.226950  ORF Transcript_84886/g.226950 Transcript_84886/m.226950 type:complete len:360 (-) Transcript_84886:181-1260(-)
MRPPESRQTSRKCVGHARARPTGPGRTKIAARRATKRANQPHKSGSRQCRHHWPQQRQNRGHEDHKNRRPPRPALCNNLSVRGWPARALMRKIIRIGLPRHAAQKRPEQAGVPTNARRTTVDGVFDFQRSPLILGQSPNSHAQLLQHGLLTSPGHETFQELIDLRLIWLHPPEHSFSTPIQNFRKPVWGQASSIQKPRLIRLDHQLLANTRWHEPQSRGDDSLEQPRNRINNQSPCSLRIIRLQHLHHRAGKRPRRRSPGGNTNGVKWLASIPHKPLLNVVNVGFGCFRFRNISEKTPKFEANQNNTKSVIVETTHLNASCVVQPFHGLRKLHRKHPLSPQHILHQHLARLRHIPLTSY